MIGRSKELKDVGRVASSFPTYLGQIEATLLAGLRLLRLNCGLCPVVFGESDETNNDIEDHLCMGVLNIGSVTDGRKPYSLAVYTTPRY